MRFASLLVSLVGVAALFILADVIRKKLKSERECYRVFTRGGAEDGTVTYDEGGRVLELYFDRAKNTIYVPTDGKWKEIMPTWAKDRKDQIIGRTKKVVGRRWIGEDWKYEETGNEKLLMSQRQ
ncbi:MAG TPA: hypothetical protein VMW38_18150 [Terriglobia bacterium]|nr:hypothetical protein [Terriglobia bacterium]